MTIGEHFTNPLGMASPPPQKVNWNRGATGQGRFRKLPYCGAVRRPATWSGLIAGGRISALRHLRSSTVLKRFGKAILGMAVVPMAEADGSTAPEFPGARTALGISQWLVGARRDGSLGGAGRALPGEDSAGSRPGDGRHVIRGWGEFRAGWRGQTRRGL